MRTINGKNYYCCPTQNVECPYWDWKRQMCSMEGGPAGECDEYDVYCDEDYDIREEDEE
jgi:hypothetical protein